MKFTDSQIHAGFDGFARAAASLLDRIATSIDFRAQPENLAGRGLASRARKRLSGMPMPGVPGWDALPPEQRSTWWVDRMGTVLSLAGAAPELLGPASDAVPLTATLRAASRGLVTCAVAREHNITDPAAQAHMLGWVLLGRELAPDGTATSPVTITLDTSPGAAGILRSAVRIGRELLAFRSDLAAGLEIADSRPHRGVLARIPAVGAIKSFTDLRSTLRADADQVSRLVTDRSVRDEFRKEKGEAIGLSKPKDEACEMCGKTEFEGCGSVFKHLVKVVGDEPHWLPMHMRIQAQGEFTWHCTRCNSFPAMKWPNDAGAMAGLMLHLGGAHRVGHLQDAQPQIDMISARLK